MKLLCEKSPHSEYSNGTSSSRESKGDLEMGASSILNNGDLPNEDMTVCCIRHGRNMNTTRMFFAEMLGTFILMFCVCGIIASTQLMRGEVGLLEYAATGGLTIIVVIFSIGPISGAHINPSVTIAFATLGQFPWAKVPFYILAQILGSIFATFVGKSVYGIQADLMITQPLHGCSTAFWAEFLATFIIMFLAASISCQAHTLGHLSGFAVGVAIALAILVTGPVSGGSLNPARSLGPAVISWRFNGIWIYLLAPTIGAVTGALLYRMLHLRHQPHSPTSSPSAELLVK